MDVSKDEPIPLIVLNSIQVLASLIVIITPIIFSIPPFNYIQRRILSSFSDLVPYRSLISEKKSSSQDELESRKYQIAAWGQIVLVAAGLAGVAVWCAVFGMDLLAAIGHQKSVVEVLLSAGMACVWLYLLAVPLHRAPSTPPWSLVIIYTLFTILGISQIAMRSYVKTVTGQYPAWTTGLWLGLQLFQTVASIATLSIIAGLHMAPPAVLARMPVVAPDDLVTLSSWITFTWMNKFIAYGNSKELEPEDLPPLSLTMQTSIVFHRFKDLSSSTLLRRILSANAIDLALDGLLTLFSVIFNYAGPFFLKRILDGLTLGTKEAMSRAYVYAFLAFLASVAKAATDLLHLWHGRRATIRIKSELIAAIYDKALRRKDASGVVASKEKIEDVKKGEKEEKKVNADSGKIVNLMASDTQRISNTAAAAYYIYGAPFEIVVASIFLYNILGWSAFAGMVVLLIATPVNSFISKRYITITQTLMKARDRRITVMTELIGAIQFIKFFAWTSQWKKRAQDARKEEMKHLVRSMINGVFFSLLWNVAPLLVTLVAFYSFIFIAQRELTVSVAFTAISLFSMVRQPLNVIPTFAVFILQAHVSVKRIEDYLQEDEVPDWVSSLKRKPETESESRKIGFTKATLQWNSGQQADSKVAEVKTQDKPLKKIKRAFFGRPTPDAAPSTSTDSSETAVEATPEPVFQLADLNVEFPTGKLSVVSGPTGSGKTAILTALLGEMELIEGHSYLPKQTTQVDHETGLRNSVAYAAQTPWLQQKSIKDNILFGEEFDEKRYEATLDACALTPDLDILEDGDQTEIGAKGVSLSGGQKARVALARAVYSYTQHVLLDDPLAAVDSHTAKHLTDKCLRGSLMKGRTIILVSHHVELLLPITDYIVRILDGRIDAQGTPAELRESGALDGLIAIEGAEVAAEEPVVASSSQDKEVTIVEEADSAKKDKKKGPGKKLVQDEERPIGNVKWETYKLYIVAATYLTWTLTLLMMIFGQLFTVGERYWLKVWGEAYTTSFTPTVSSIHPLNWVHPQHYSHSEFTTKQHIFQSLHLPVSSNSTGPAFNASGVLSDLPSANAHPGFYLAVYALIVLGDALLGSLASGVGSWGSYRAAVTIHDRLLGTVLKSTVRFFDTTPLGRIINRFSKDVETIDGSLNSSLMTVIVYVANLFVAIAVVATIVPWFLVPAAIISYLYYQYTLLYLRAGRSVRRLEATLRSPIYSGFSEVLDGVVSVRAFGVEERFFKTLCEQVDKTQAASYYYWMMNRWLLIRFDSLGALSVFFTTLFALSGAVKPGSAGMAIISAQSFVMACYWVSRFWGQLEMDFNAVERVEEYLHLPQEPPSTTSNAPPAYWPSTSSGSDFLRVEDLEIKYAPDLPTVFKGSFTIAAGEKIGLIGRTGSGKSTLAMSMLRFSEPAGGKIVLDGIDITSIGVDDLRSRITYIPQDAVLFSGTVRENLDPFNEHSDDELLDALSRVNLGPREAPSASTSRAPSRVPSKTRLSQLAKEDAETSRDGAASPAPSSTNTGNGKMTVTLTTEVSSGGANFSQGQRQLVAMARALLRRSNLIIMDEATASVDFATDEAIQSAIRSEFKSSTLLTIAHRLSSVIDYDRLLVLSDGKVAEFDTPINLLRKDGSLFKSLCEKSGKYRDLYRAAEKKEGVAAPPEYQA